MSGGVIIARNLWDDPAFQNEPFSEREAWVWLICEAQWKPRERRVGKVIVQLDRGQLAHSTRFLAEAWKWSHAKVRRYLDRLEKLKLIRRESGTGVSVVTLCKYNEYQLTPQPSGTEAAQKRHRSGTNHNKDEIREEGKERDTNVSLDLSPPEPASPIAEAVKVYNDAAEQAGWPRVQKMTPTRSKAIKARLSECGGVEGWRIAMDKGKASDFLTGRATGTTPATFDWLSKQSNFAKLMEGNYDNRPNTTRRNSPSYTTAREIAFAAAAIRSPRDDCF